MKHPAVYILSNIKNGTLYIGVTSNLVKRIWEHKNGFVDSFSKEHDLKKLVYYEMCQDMNSAIIREKRLKGWKREWIIELIEKENPDWIDLYESIL